MSDRVDKSDGVPGNFREVVRPMIEAALLAQPEDIIGFAADYFEEQLKQNENEWCGSGEMNIHASPEHHKQTPKDANNSSESGNRSPKAIDFEMNVENNPDASTDSLENQFNAKAADKVLITTNLETGSFCSIPNTAFSEHAVKAEITEHVSVPTDEMDAAEHRRNLNSAEESQRFDMSEASRISAVTKWQCEETSDSAKHVSTNVTVDLKQPDNQHLIFYSPSNITESTPENKPEHKPENATDLTPNENETAVGKKTSCCALCSAESEKLLLDYRSDGEDMKMKATKVSTKESATDRIAEKTENTADEDNANIQTPESAENQREKIKENFEFFGVQAEKQESNDNGLSGSSDFPPVVHYDARAESNEDPYSMEVSLTLEKLLNQVASSDSKKSKNSKGFESLEMELNGIFRLGSSCDQQILGSSKDRKGSDVQSSHSTNERKSCSGLSSCGMEFHDSPGEGLSPLRKAPRICSDSVISWEASHAQRYREWVNRNKDLCCVNPKFHGASRYDLRSNQARNSDSCFGKNVPCDFADCSGKWSYCGTQNQVLCVNHKKQQNDTFSESFHTNLASDQQPVVKGKKPSLSKPAEDSKVKDGFRCEASTSGKTVKQRVGKIFNSPLSSERTSKKNENNFSLDRSGSPGMSRTVLPSKRKSEIICRGITMEGDTQGPPTPWRLKRDGQNDRLGKKASLPEKRDYKKFMKTDETDGKLTQSSYTNVRDETWEEYPTVLCEEQRANSKSTEEQEFNPAVLNLEFRDINNNTVLVDPSQERLNSQWERMENNELFLQGLSALAESKDGRNIVWDNMQDPGTNNCAEVSESCFNIESGDYEDDYVIIEDMMNQKDTASKKSSLSERSSSDERGDIDSADSGERINTLDVSSVKNFSKDVDSQEKMFVGEGGDMPATGAAKYANEHEKLDQQTYGKCFLKNGSHISKRSSDSALNLKTPSVFDSTELSKEGRGFSLTDFPEAPTLEKTLLSAQLDLTLVKLLKNDRTDSESTLDDFENISGYHTEIPGKTTVADVSEKTQDMSLSREGVVGKNSFRHEATDEYGNGACQINAHKTEEEGRNEFEKGETNTYDDKVGEEPRKMPTWPFRDVFKPRNVNDSHQMKSTQVSSQETQKSTGSSGSSALQLFLLETEMNSENGSDAEVEESATRFKDSDFSNMEPTEEAKTTEESVLEKDQVEAVKKFVAELQKRNGSNLGQSGSKNLSSYETPLQNDNGRKDEKGSQDVNVTTSPGTTSGLFARAKLSPLQADDRWAGFIHMVNYQEADDKEDLSSGRDCNSGSDQDAKD